MFMQVRDFERNIPLNCCPLIGDGFVVVDSLFYVPPIVCGNLCLVIVLVYITLLPL